MIPLQLQLYNTRTRRKQRFEPIEAGHVRIYSCGPTVYSAQHLGNLRSQLFADLLKRVFLYCGYRVTHVINITDVGHLTDDADAGEDKLERAARERGESAGEIARRFTEQWLRDRRRLGCLEPEVLCRATEHIPQQIAMIEALEQRGFSYRIDDGIYFDTARFPRYADFARLDLAAQASAGRGADVPGKRHPADFALWKFAPPGTRRQQEWDSPWGRGFPGWHIECSAMSRHYLGDRFDVHTGGIDHVPVHHTNEIAQSECALGVTPWVNFWLHNEFLDLHGEKMSKSRGAVALLDDLIEAGLPPLAFRYFFLQAHYRQQQSYGLEALQAAATGYERLLARCVELRAAGSAPLGPRSLALRERFAAAIADDLNAPQGLALAWEIARDEALAPAERWGLLADCDRVLGLDLAHAVPRERAQESDPAIDALVAERVAARARRDWQRADAIRDELAAQGIVIEDSGAGSRWRRE